MRILLAACATLAAALPLRAQTAPADSARVYELAEVDHGPRPANLAELRAALTGAYPPARREAGISGTVVVSLVVGPDGAPRDVRVVESTDSAFDAPAVAVVGVLRFAPARVGDAPVSVRAQLPIHWQPTLGAQAQADSSTGGVRVYEIAEVDAQPRPLNVGDLQRAMERGYPTRLRDAGASGSVVVRFRVDRDGKPRDLRVTRSSGPEFDAATLAAVAVLRFSPARLGGEPVDAWMDLPIQWSVLRD